MSIPLKDALRAGRVTIGTFLLELASRGIPKVLAHAGFDFVVIDMEHGVFTRESSAALIAFARASGITPLVRIAEISRTNVLTALEAGAGGIMAPMIGGPDDVDTLYRLAMYPPSGERGTGLGTAHTDYEIPDAPDYLRAANESMVLVGQIETTQALDNLDEILSPGKLDVAFVGPLDLSVSLGSPGNLNTREFQAAIALILDRCAEHEVIPGAFAADPESAMQWIGRGCRLIACSFDLAMLAGRARQIVRAIRDQG